MALCPLLKTECIKDKCQWWYGAESERYNNCSISLILANTWKIKSDLEVISAEFQAFRSDFIDSQGKMDYNI